MTDDSLKDLLFEAIERPAGERAAFLAQRCADGALRARIEGLLAAHDAADTILATPGILGDARVADAATLPSGTLVGPYRIEALLGEGGFGAVYRAMQEEPVRRRVAIKILKSIHASAEVTARFAAERQLLAVMEHPGIAEVFDAGLTNDRRPYVVMEFVDGAPITEWCDTHRLTVAERVELFVAVAHAVEHAHQKGVVHRDIKPSNILVAEVDGKPVPKIIDFGIAKVLDAEIAGHSGLTQTAQVLGTPRYMAPEQAAGTADVDTRADIYSLGAVLYELLSGVRLLEGVQLARGGAGSGRDESDPFPRPSNRVAALGADADPLAALRGVDASRLARTLRGDVDWIVMRAIEHERERRYPAASALAADLRRYLAHEPVEAGPPTFSYRLRRMVRRHRAAFVSAAAALAALVIGFGVAVSGLIEAERGRSDALASLDEATAVTELLADALGSASPRDLGRDVMLVDVLDRAARGVSERLAGRPRAEARLRAALGDTYFQLGRLDAAENQLALADALAKEVLGPDHDATLRARLGMARVHLERGRVDAARTAAREAHALAAAAGGPNGRIALDVRRLESAIAEVTGDLDLAESVAREVRDARAAAFGAEDLDTIRSDLDCARLDLIRGRASKARPPLLATRDALAKRLPAEHPDLLMAQRLLAEAHGRLLEFAEAEHAWRVALAGCERRLGAKHPETIAARNGLAVALGWRQNWDLARPLFETNLAMQTEVLGARHRDTLATLHNLATIDGLMGNPERQEEREREVLRIVREDLGPEHLQTLCAEVALGRVLAARGRHEDAMPLLAHAVEGYRHSFDPTDVRLLEALALLADTYVRDGDPERARPIVEERIRGRLAGAAAPDASVPVLRAAAIDLLRAELPDLRRPADAVRLLLRASGLPGGHDIAMLELLAVAQSEAGDLAAALETADRAIAAAPADGPDLKRLQKLRASIAAKTR